MVLFKKVRKTPRLVYLCPVDLLEPESVVVEPAGDGLGLGVQLGGQVVHRRAARVGVQGKGYVQRLPLLLGTRFVMKKRRRK